MVKYWNKAQEAVGSPFLDIFITWLKWGPEYPELTLSLQQESARETSKGFFQLCPLFQEHRCPNLQENWHKRR